MKTKDILKIVVISVVLVIIVGVIIFFLRSQKKQQPYIETQVKKTNVQKTINVDATMNPDVYVDIRSELPTLIKSVNVSINDKVEKGEELFRLDKRSISAQINNARLAVERAELAEKQARRKWDMLKPEERESTKKATQQARETLRELYAQASKTTITSPISGIVVEHNARVGEVAQGIIMKIIDPKSLQVEVFIPEVDIAKIQKGDRAFIVFDAYPNKIIKGTFQSMNISSTLKGGSTYFKAFVDIDDKNDITILDGMNAEVDIEIAHKNNVVAVSRKFAKKDEQGYFVRVLNVKTNEDKFKKKYFAEGLIGDQFIEVVSGLSVGEKIILPEEK